MVRPQFLAPAAPAQYILLSLKKLFENLILMQRKLIFFEKIDFYVKNYMYDNIILNKDINLYANNILKLVYLLKFN